MPKLKRRSDGRYQMSAIIDGKRKYFYGQTQKEAAAKMNEAISLSSRGVDLISAASPFSKWANAYLNSIKVSLTEQQFRKYKVRLDYFTSIFGEVEINKIRPHHIQKAINALAEENPRTHKPTAKKTLIEYRAILRRTFDFAIVNRAAEYNPCTMITLPKDAPKKQRSILTEEQKQWIIDTPHKMQTAAMIMLFAGLRKGELCALMWSDIDFKNKTITVNKSFDFYENKLKSTKTESGVRTIPMPDILCDYLKSQPQPSLYVMEQKTRSQIEKCWLDYMKVLNQKYGDFNNLFSLDKEKNPPIIIKTFTMHELRHTYCSWLYSAGVDLLTAKYLMGHKNVQTTLAVYTHLEKEKRNISIDKLNEYFNNGAKNMSTR